MVVALGLWSAAAAPPETGVFADPRVSISEVDSLWRIQIEDRVLEVSIPTTSQDLALITALVTSLLTELEPPEGPRPPIRLKLVPQPPPPTPAIPQPPPEVSPPPEDVPPPAAPTPPEDLDDLDPRFGLTEVRTKPPTTYRWTAWVGPTLVARPRLSPGPGVRAGASVGQRSGATGTVGLTFSRPTRFATDSTAWSMAGGGELWVRLAAAQLSLGGEVVWRHYARRGVRVAGHVLPVVLVGASLPSASGPWRIEPAAYLTVDVGPTSVRGDERREPLPPFGLRLELRLGRAFAPVVDG